MLLSASSDDDVDLGEGVLEVVQVNEAGDAFVQAGLFLELFESVDDGLLVLLDDPQGRGTVLQLVAFSCHDLALNTLLCVFAGGGENGAEWEVLVSVNSS